MNTIKNRISKLREEMQKYNLDAVYVSGTDPHSSEYMPERWQTRAFISGFTGSYGMLAITMVDAGLWTDTRYFIQAEEQLEGSEIKMHKLRVPDAVSPELWLANNLKSGDNVGIDAKTISVSGFLNLKNILAEKEIKLTQIPDLFDLIWAERPSIPNNEVFELDIQLTGLSRQEKRASIISELVPKGADEHVVSMLDELAWTFNLRGSDVDYNPVFTGYGIIGKDENTLFLELDKLPGKLKSKLQNEGVSLKSYHEFYSYLAEIKNKTVFLDPATTNYAILEALKKNEIVEGTSKVASLKARKNEVELDGFRRAMKKDGAALIEALYWLKINLGERKVTEYDFGRKLAECRAQQEDFKDESFPPIVGYKSHGAMVHLIVGNNDAFEIENEGILLFDSGAQYLHGTTDITRTIALGEVTAQQKIDFTLVLKGVIALSEAKFPYGTKGCSVDILARKALWNQGMNYGHGTGHGVGHFLNVHEGPMAIRQEYNENNIEPGHVMSNEPGLYREGLYGVRTENMIVCVEKEVTEFGRFLGFETLTLCPIDTTLIRKDLLSEGEIDWLNSYHSKVNCELKPLLKNDLHNFLDDLTKDI